MADESGIYLPEPDGYRVVQLNSHPGGSQLVDGEIEQIRDSIETFLADKELIWFDARDVHLGRTVYLSRQFVEGIQSIGEAWIDRKPIDRSQGRIAVPQIGGMDPLALNRAQRRKLN